MDSDDFDDDILDEDLILAASQPPTQAKTNRPDAAGFQAHVSRPASPDNFNIQRTTHRRALETDGASAVDLDDLPSDAFSSSPDGRSLSQRSLERQPVRLVGAPIQNYRQATLFGHLAQPNGIHDSASRLNTNRAFRADLPTEPPTHHQIDRDAMKTWVYPTNLGPIRDYQYSIVKNGLFNNTLVALPTGLGKTFIAATVMLNFFRWTRQSKIIFVAPTKPLVSQQVDACFHIAGIPRSQTTLLTGEISPALRAEEWANKRVFFMTPQTLENDLSSGIADPKSIALIVVDEAHRATGNYAYVKVINFIRRFSSSFRILALTATPGSKVEAVQEVIDSLGISHIEIRTEESLDIRQYVHQRDEDIVLLDPTEEMELIKGLFSRALKPLVEKLSSQNIWYGRDPMSLTTYGLVKAKQDWFARAGRHANQGLKNMMNAVFAILASLAHPIKLLNFHGIKPFYDNLAQFRAETEGKGEKGSKYKRQITESPDFQKMMNIIAGWVRKDDFVSHPKLTYLCDTVLNHFMDAGDGRGNSDSTTRIIVFSEYRDSAEEIVRVLNHHKPLVRAAVFVGQADTKKSEGMKQSDQIERIRKFKDGTFNVLVATSIGEEGLDIGQVDLIICYDASASPIRMLQRMGRTGRKRAGKVVLLLMRGKEEAKFTESKDAYEKMQMMICDGSRFNFRHDLSTRVVPRDIKPEVDKRHVDIPVENTQNNSLPEPKKGRLPKKKPPKKFNMPDGVETGFTSVASLFNRATATTKTSPGPAEADEIADIPDLDRVSLTSQEVEELRRVYQNLPFYQNKVEEIETVDVQANPVAQRTLRKTANLKHGERTKRCVQLFRLLSKLQSSSERYSRPYGDTDQSHFDRLPLPQDVSASEDGYPGIRRSLPKKKKHARLHDDGADGISNLRATAPVHSKRLRDLASESDATLEGSDEEMALPAKRRRRQPATRNPKQPRARRKAISEVYDESADEGDDCRRTSDLEVSEDSDDGSDLSGFIVDDEMATSSVLPTSSVWRRSSSPTSPPDQDSEDDVPSMSQLVRHKRSRVTKQRKTIIESSNESSD